MAAESYENGWKIYFINDKWDRSNVKPWCAKCGKRPINGIDNCIYGLIKALNDNGLETDASCCGHGIYNGEIKMKDGKIIQLRNLSDIR